MHPIEAAVRDYLSKHSSLTTQLYERGSGVVHRLAGPETIELRDLPAHGVVAMLRRLEREGFVKRVGPVVTRDSSEYTYRWALDVPAPADLQQVHWNSAPISGTGRETTDPKDR